MKKGITRVTATVLALLITVSCVYSAFAASPAENNRLVSTLGIMVGDENGDFDGDGYLTREQLAKITVSIADPEYIPTSSVSPYKDVSYRSWSSGYIKHVSELGLFIGFPDGTFRPEENVNIEQACKIMLNLLGYGNEVASADWAQSQINAANRVGILEDVTYTIGQPVSRENVAKLIENTLLTQLKDSQVYLISSLKCTYFDNAVIISDKNLSGGYVSTTVGNFKKTVAITDDSIGKSGKVVVNKKNELIYFEANDNRVDSYIVKSVAGDSITVFNQSSGITGIADETLSYINGQQMPYSQMKSLLKTGDKLSIIKDEFGNVDYIFVSGHGISDPGFASSFPITDNTAIIRDGSKSDRDSLDSLDICYYISDVDTILAYSKRVSGVFENAYPTKENISSITVSGAQYTIGYKNASQKLSSSGNIQYGDTVTLLFGKDNTVIDVISMSENASLVGYLIDCNISQRQTENGNTVYEYVAQVLTPDGNVNSYSAEKDYENYEGRVVKVSFKTGKAALSTVKDNNSISGTFSWSKKTLGKYKLSDDLDIIDVMEVDYENIAGKGIKVFPQRIDKNSLSSSNILYANIEDGEITELILDDYTGDIYDYGIVLKAENVNAPTLLMGTYQLNVKGNILQYVTQNKTYSVSTGSVVAFDAVGTNPVLMKKINSYSGKVTSMDDVYVYVGNSKYLLSDDVIIYNQVSNTTSGTGLRYEIIEKEDIDYDKTVTAYYDKAENKGGRVRVIVVRR